MLRSFRLVVTAATMLFIALSPSHVLGQEDTNSTRAKPYVADPETVATETAIIEAVWSHFTEAARAGDVESAVLYFVPDKRDNMAKLFRAMGSSFSGWIDEFKVFAPQEIGEEIAVYGLVVNENGIDRGYLVYFAKHPELGWVIYQL